MLNNHLLDGTRTNMDKMHTDAPHVVCRVNDCSNEITLNGELEGHVSIFLLILVMAIGGRPKPELCFLLG